MTEETKPFAQRVQAVMQKMSYMKKDGKNSHFRYNFLSEAAVKAKLNPLLAEFGLYVKRTTFDCVPGSTPGSCIASCSLTLGNALADPKEDGLYVDEVTYMGLGGGMDSGDKGPMKACAAALKYAITQGFLVETGDDPEDDAGDASGPDALVARIKGAESVKELVRFRPAVTALRDSADFARVRESYQTRLSELEASK